MGATANNAAASNGMERNERANIGGLIVVGNLEIPQVSYQTANLLTCLRQSRANLLSLLCRHHQYFNAGCRVFLMKYLFRSLLKILGLRIRNVGEDLWVPVCQRKPRALHLHHDAMAAAEGVEQIRHREVDVSLFAWRQRLGFFPAISELGAERLSAQQLLVAAHLQRRRVQNTLVRAHSIL